MALGTVTEVKRGVMGDLKYIILDVQPTTGANYTANGESISLGTFGMQEVWHASVENRSEVAAMTDYFLDVGVPGAGTTPKLVAIDMATAAEEAASQDLSTHRVRIFALGK